MNSSLLQQLRLFDWFMSFFCGVFLYFDSTFNSVDRHDDRELGAVEYFYNYISFIVVFIGLSCQLWRWHFLLPGSADRLKQAGRVPRRKVGDPEEAAEEEPWLQSRSEAANEEKEVQTIYSCNNHGQCEIATE